MSTIDSKVEQYQENQREIEALRDQIDELRSKGRDLRDEIDADRAAGAHSYPTNEQVEGLREAFIAIRDQHPVESHLGGRVPNGHVSFHPRGWIHLSSEAPHSVEVSQGRIWGFTDEDTAAIVVAVEAVGFEVLEEWHSFEWISLTVKIPEAS